MLFSPLVLTAHAADIITPVGNANPGASGDLTGSVQSITSSIVDFLFLLGGALAVIYLLWSGIQYITSAGSPDKAKTARLGIINAMIGIVVMMAAWMIIRLATSVGFFASNLTGKNAVQSGTSATTSSTTSGTGGTTSATGSGTSDGATNSDTQSEATKSSTSSGTDAATSSNQP